jgi:hypothetical protein
MSSSRGNCRVESVSRTWPPFRGPAGGEFPTTLPMTRPSLLLPIAAALAACGGDSSAAVNAPPACAVPAPTISGFVATPASTLAGQNVTLSWTVSGATSVSLSPGSGTVAGSSLVVAPTAVTQYQLSATNCAGTTTAQTTVNVAQPALYASPDVFTPATPVDGIVVSARYGTGGNAYTRTIPILVRFPQGTTGRRPLILWSHGGGMLPDGKYHNAEWGDLLVRAGYIVVTMSHMPRTVPELSMLYTEFGLPLPIDPVASEVGEFAANIDRPRDAIAVLNALTNLEQTFPQLAGRVDFDRIGVAGWSRGSYTARTTACATINLAPSLPRYSFRDTTRSTNTPLRVSLKAVLANSPQGPGRLSFYDNGGGDNSWANCTLPDLTQTASGDATDTPPANRVMPFPLMPGGNKHMMFIADQLATHESFGLVNPIAKQFDPWIGSTALAFLDGYVKGLAPARAYLSTANLNVVSSTKAALSAR